MRHSGLLATLLILLPSAYASTAFPSFAGINIIESGGNGRTVVHLPSQANLTNVSVQEGADLVALVLSGPRTFAFVRWVTGSFPDSIGESPCCSFPPGDYHLYLVSRSPVTMTLKFDGLPGQATLPVAPSAGEVQQLTALFPTVGVTPITIKNHTFTTTSRSVLITTETSDVISGPGATVIESTHTVKNSDGEADCQPNGKVFIVLNVLGGTGSRISREFVKDAGSWDLQVSYAAPGTGLTVRHTAHGIAVPIDADDPLQAWTNPVWRILFEAPGADSVNVKHRERAQNLVCAVLANP